MSHHNTRPAEGSPEELIWLRGYEAGVIDMRADAKASGWRDIESAPKDGTPIIAWRADAGWFECRWERMGDLVPEGNECGDPDHEGWFHGEWGLLEDDLTPTQWTLPPPPGEEDEGDLNLMKLGFDEVVRHKGDQLEALRAENAELKARYDKLEAAARECCDAADAMHSEADVQRFHDLYFSASKLRTVLSTKGGEDD